MKTARTQWLILGLLLLGAAALVLHQHRALRAERAKTTELTRRLDRLSVRQKSVGNGVTVLEERLRVMTEKAVEADARYQEERRTHEPLRQQIQRMQESEMRASGESARRADELSRLSRSLEESRAAVRELTASNRLVAAAAEALRAERDRGVQAQADFQEALRAAQTAAAAFSNRWVKARAEAADEEKKATAAERRASSLADDASAARAALTEALTRLAERSNRVVRLEAEARKP
jgi:chromosome segregation ATPase